MKEGGLEPLKRGILSEKIGEGSHATIHEIKEAKEAREGFSGLIVKIGKTEKYSPPLLKALRIVFSREKVSRFLEKYLGPEFKVDPDIDFIKNGVAEYLLIKKYFGYDETKSASREELLLALQNKNHPFYKEFLEMLGEEKLAKLIAVLKKHQKENFLPREKTVIGHPPDLTFKKAQELKDSGKKLPATFYIFQERIGGENVVPLSELSERELTDRRELLEKLLVFAVLTKKMYRDTGRLIDTRPEEIAKHPVEWFQKTGNILADKDRQKLFFIDTRWLWKKDSRLGEKGLNLVEYFGLRSVDRAIKKYTELLNGVS